MPVSTAERKKPKSAALPQPLIPLPPGLPQSPLATWAVSAASSAAIEAANFGFINPGPAQKIVALIGFIGPLVITAADAIIRHGHATASTPPSG